MAGINNCFENRRYDYNNYGKDILTEGDLDPVQIALKKTLEYFSTNNNLYNATNKALGNLKLWNDEAEKVKRKVEAKVEIKQGDWGDITLGMTRQYGQIYTVLNMANAIYPGGHYTEKPQAQEENMFRRSSCHFFLERIDMNETKTEYKNDKTKLINAENNIVYLDNVCPRVCIMDTKYNIVNEDQFFPFYEMKAAALDRRQKHKELKQTIPMVYDDSETKEMEKKISAQFTTMMQQNQKYCILSAFGCGAFLNPAEQVAKIYADCIFNFRDHFEHIVFAIFDRGTTNFDSFNKTIPKILKELELELEQKQAAKQKLELEQKLEQKQEQKPKMFFKSLIGATAVIGATAAAIGAYHAYKKHRYKYLKYKNKYIKLKNNTQYIY